MTKEEFRSELKKRGKKPHVVEGLVNSLSLFEEYLHQRGKQLDDASEKDLQDYSLACEAEKKGSTKIMVRGIMLYYSFSGSKTMTQLAGKLRESQTAKTRKVFQLRDFMGVNVDYIKKLSMLGIIDINQMIEAGKTPNCRKELSDKTGIPSQGILELVKLSNLARSSGLKAVRARLYHDAGFDTWEEIAKWDPEKIRERLSGYIKKTDFEGIPPTPKEAANAVATARKMPRIVEW
ncbi:DUF4332 domain-containing protein [candidate division WOR-3 bacterium]|nr:DUF4332 domain-containing protein [candidate division WOR-3 bacterium]